MRYTVKKTFAIAAATGNALLVRVKDNQPRLLECLAGLCAVQPPIDHLDTIDRHAHGREEHRRIEVFAAERLDPDWRPFVACIVRVTRRTWCRDTRTGLWRQRREVAYYAGQVPLEARACAAAVRGHWGSRTATTTCATAPWARMPAASGTSPVSSPACAPSRSISRAATASPT